MVICRNAIGSDIDVFTQLYGEYEVLGLSYVPRKRRTRDEYEEWYNELIQHEFLTLVEEIVSGEVVGYAICEAYTDGNCILKELYIEPTSRYKYYSRICLEHICKEAKAIGMKEISATSYTAETDAFLYKVGFRSKKNNYNYLLKL